MRRVVGTVLVDSDRRSAQVDWREVADTAGGVGPRTSSSRSSWKAFSRRGGMAFRAQCCCDGDGRFGLSRRMLPNLASYRQWSARNRADALSGHAGQLQRSDRDRVCHWASDADHGYGRRGDAEGRRGVAGRWTPTVIPIASGVQVWIATGNADMRQGISSRALLSQGAFTRDPHGGDLSVFRGKSGKLIKILWRD